MTITTNSFDFDRTKPVKPNRNVRIAIAACAGVLAVAAVLVVGGGDNSTSAVEHMRTQSEYTQHLVDTYQIPAATLQG